MIRTFPLALLAGTSLALARGTNADPAHLVNVGPPVISGSFRILAVGPASAPGLIYADTTPGVQKSENAGATWTGVAMPAAEFVMALAIDPSAPATVYAGTQPDLPGVPFPGNLYKSTDSGRRWSRLVNFPVSTVYSLTVIAAPARRVFAATQQGIYCSPDEGASWFLVGASGTLVYRLAFSTHHPLAAYAFGYYAVFKSADAGETWQQVQSSFPVNVTSIALDPEDPSTALVSGFPWVAPGSPPPISLRTTDGGASWDAFSVSNASTFAFAYVSSIVYAVAYSQAAGGVFRSSDRGATWQLDSDGIAGQVILSLATNGSQLYAETYNSIYKAILGSGCSAGSTILCLGLGRFQVSVSWSASNIGQSGAGQTMPLTGDSGAFWFFQPSNIELVVKVLDGRAINGHFWVFYGALTNVGYTITVTDTATDAVRTYTNPEGQLASRADTSAF